MRVTKNLPTAIAQASLIFLSFGIAPAQAALLRLDFSSPTIPGAANKVVFESSSPNLSTSADLGIYKNAVKDYDISIGSGFFPGKLSSSGEIFNVDDAEISVNPLLSTINFAFGHGAQLNFSFALGTIKSIDLPNVGTIGNPETTQASFTPGSRFTAYLDQTSVSVVAVNNPTSIPESSNIWALAALGALGAGKLIKQLIVDS